MASSAGNERYGLTRKDYRRMTSRGRFYSDAVVANSANLAVVGSGVSRKLFAGEDPIGGTIEIRGVFSIFPSSSFCY